MSGAALVPVLQTGPNETDRARGDGDIGNIEDPCPKAAEPDVQKIHHITARDDPVEKIAESAADKQGERQDGSARQGLAGRICLRRLSRRL